MALSQVIKPPDHCIPSSTETFLGLDQCASNLHLTSGGQKPCKCDLVKATCEAAHLLNQSIIDLYPWLDIGHHLLGDLS